MADKSWFSVDHAGLGRLVAHSDPSFVVLELVQNAWDAGASSVDVRLERIPRTGYARLSVIDDSPSGFIDFANAYTLFATTAKAGDPEKRGRFCLGEKTVLALCRNATIVSTTAAARFDDKGRTPLRRRTRVGTEFHGEIQLSDEALAQIDKAVGLLLPPASIRTVFNGRQIDPVTPFRTVEATLPTLKADASGALRRTQRQTLIEVHEPRAGSPAMIYEMGLPVCETGDRWSVNVRQRVPLDLQRTNVPSSYLSKLRAIIATHMVDQLHSEDASGWARDALQHHGTSMPADVVRRLADLRFSELRVAYDPSDIEANQRAVSLGYTVITGGSMTGAEWQAMRQAQAVVAAGQVAPTPKPFSADGKPLRVLDPTNFTPQIAATVVYAQWVSQALIGSPVTIEIANDVAWPFRGAYSPGRMHLNLGRLGHKWFAGPLAQINELLLHELAHHYSNSHLDDSYHEALCSLGAKLADLAIAQPQRFVRHVAQALVR